LETITPDELELGPPTGRWRQERLAPREDDRLFASILVAIRGDESGWMALDQALVLAHREHARLQGLHVVPNEEQTEHPDAQAIQQTFERRCAEAGVLGRLAFDVGPVHRKICDRARWTDLVVTSLNYPPMPGPMSKMGSGIVTLIRRCPRPVLVVPDEPSPFHRALLAYDGTPKAREALFVATYLTGRWGVPLTLVTVAEGERDRDEILEDARVYLDAHGVRASLAPEQREGGESVADAILRRADVDNCDLILMGGYGMGPVVEAVIGSTVDRVLRKSTRPILICR
jgi:nucleotide-binding universal stress UspA family protein